MTRKLPQISKEAAIEAVEAVRGLFRNAKSYSDIDRSYSYIDRFSDFLTGLAPGLETLVNRGSLREYACLFYTALKKSGDLPTLCGLSISKACNEVLKDSRMFSGIQYYPDGSFLMSWDESNRRFGRYLTEIIGPKLAEENPQYLGMMTKLMETLGRRGELPLATGFVATVVYRAMEIELSYSCGKSSEN